MIHQFSDERNLDLFPHIGVFPGFRVLVEHLLDGLLDASVITLDAGSIDLADA